MQNVHGKKKPKKKKKNPKTNQNTNIAEDILVLSSQCLSALELNKASFLIF